jgi:hypothetical protein
MPWPRSSAIPLWELFERGPDPVGRTQFGT